MSGWVIPLTWCIWDPFEKLGMVGRVLDAPHNPQHWSSWWDRLGIGNGGCGENDVDHRDTDPTVRPELQHTWPSCPEGAAHRSLPRSPS